MINLDANSRLTKWFVWSCDHLPLTVGPPYTENDKEHAKTGAYYVLRGTTLCHIFWATLWVPLLVAAFFGLMLTMFAMLHILPAIDFARKNPDAGAVAQVAMYFVPEMAAAALALIAGTVILMIIGGSKSGFFALLWQYLKGAKQRICPIVRFDGARMQAAE